eukprot:9059089-Alexandrium_andersonii.AAC.1
MPSRSPSEVFRRCGLAISRGPSWHARARGRHFTWHFIAGANVSVLATHAVTRLWGAGPSIKM